MGRQVVPGPKPHISTILGDRPPLQTGEHRTDGKYKFLGGGVGHDGKVYLFPSDSDYVVQIDPRPDAVTEVGPNLRDHEPLHTNKWQNGYCLEDGCLYGIPLKSTSILR